MKYEKFRSNICFFFVFSNNVNLQVRQIRIFWKTKPSLNPFWEDVNFLIQIIRQTKCPQRILKAFQMNSKSKPNATLMRPQSGPKVALKWPQCSPKVAPMQPSRLVGNTNIMSAIGGILFLIPWWLNYFGCITLSKTCSMIVLPRSSTV